MVTIEYSAKDRWRGIWLTFFGIVSLWVWMILHFALAVFHNGSLLTLTWIDFVFAILYAYGLGRNIQDAAAVQWLRTKYQVDHSTITKIWPDGRRETIKWSELERISGRLSSPEYSRPKGYRIIRYLSWFLHSSSDGIRLWEKDVSMSISRIETVSIVVRPLLASIADAGPHENLLKQAISFELENNPFLYKTTSLPSWAWYLGWLTIPLTIIAMAGGLWVIEVLPVWGSLGFAAIGLILIYPACRVAAWFLRLDAAAKKLS